MISQGARNNILKIRILLILPAILHFRFTVVYNIDATIMTMGTTLVMIVSLSTIMAETCELYSLSMPYEGRYCSSDGTVTPLLAPNLCRSMCLQSPTCLAYNYNFTEKTCTRLTSPCPEAFVDPVMEFVVFTQKPHGQCYEWVPYTVGDVFDERMVSETSRIICRMVRSGSDVVCYWHVAFRKCYAYLSSAFNSGQGYTCERLRIMEGCTIYWFPYTAREPIPPRAVTAGQMANGDTVYVTKFDYMYNGQPKNFPGHYVEGAAETVAGFAGVACRSSTMMMMVVL